MNANKALDAQHEDKSLTDIIALPPSALQGLAAHADELLRAFHIKTIEDLGQWKHAVIANGIATLADLETNSVETHT